MGVSPITWQDMFSYFTLNMIVPTEQEIQMICALDRIALKQYNEDQQEKKKENKIKAKTKPVR